MAENERVHPLDFKGLDSEAAALASEFMGPNSKTTDGEPMQAVVRMPEETIRVHPTTGKRYVARSATYDPRLAVADIVGTPARPVPYTGSRPPSKLNPRPR